MLINSEQKFFNLLRALRLLTPEGQQPARISESDRAKLTRLIANGWPPEDAVAYLRDCGGRLH
ncbi:MAG: hypothetical protein ABSA13_09420 [Beijerinckiaceae bacterium]|jgi:hypothetical protein